MSRWSHLTSAVLGYIRGVPLVSAATWAARAARTLTLEDVTRQRFLGPPSSGPPAALAAAASSSSAPFSTPAVSTPVVVPEALEVPLSEAMEKKKEEKEEKKNKTKRRAP